MMSQQGAGPYAGTGELVALRVLRVPDAIPISVLFLNGLRGLRTHFMRGGSVLCFAPARPCSRCDKEAGVFKAYAPSYVFDTAAHVWRPAVLEATGSLEEKLRGRSLRGEEWLLWREAASTKRRVVCGRFVRSHELEEVPQAFAIEDVLMRLYHTDRLPAWVANPVPPSQQVETFQGPRPEIPQFLMPPEEDKKPAPPEVWRNLKQRFLKPPEAGAGGPGTGSYVQLPAASDNGGGK